MSEVGRVFCFLEFRPGDSTVVMANAAGVVATASYEAAVRPAILEVASAVRGQFIGFWDRIRAKAAYHNRGAYEWLATCALTPVVADAWWLRRLRRIDTDGLGVWYLARLGPQRHLEDLCRAAIALPGLGPPRSIARTLDRSWSGELTCLFGEPAGFDALMSATLIGAGHAATLVAAQLLAQDGAGKLAGAASELTRTAAAAQAAGRAYARVMGDAETPAKETARWMFQAVNLLRRIVNRTDLTAVDEQNIREAAREALAAAETACASALKLVGERANQTRTEATAARDKFAALARTTVALAARVAVALRADNAGTLLQPNLSARLLGDVVKSVRPWRIDLRRNTVPGCSTLDQLAAAANDLAEESAEILESWSVLHQYCSQWSGSVQSTRPAWADRLVCTLAHQWTCESVIQSLRTVGGKSEQAVAAAVELTLLRGGSLRLVRELWKLIRTPHCSPLERSLAFQLYLRIEAGQRR